MATRRKRSKVTFAEKFSIMQKVFAAAIALLVAGGSGVLFFFKTFETKESAKEHYAKDDEFRTKYWQKRKEDNERLENLIRNSRR